MSEEPPGHVLVAGLLNFRLIVEVYRPFTELSLGVVSD